jgi:hypothetical protein
MSRAMPTISILPTVFSPNPTRLPMGSSFGKYLRASVSLMMATWGARLSSCALN